jgi:hypothetical protein
MLARPDKVTLDCAKAEVTANAAKATRDFDLCSDK